MLKMEVCACTCGSLYNLPQSLPPLKHFLSLNPLSSISCTIPGRRLNVKAITRATSSGKEGSEETSSVPIVRYGHQAAEKYSEIAEEASIPTTNTEAFDLFHNLEAKLDSEDTSSVLLLGGGSLIAVWIAVVLVGAIDSIPLFPKLMEVVGLAYTLWFSTRYLLFKKNREELVVKIEEIKEQVLGSRNGD